MILLIKKYSQPPFCDIGIFFCDIRIFFCDRRFFFLVILRRAKDPAQPVFYGIMGNIQRMSAGTSEFAHRKKKYEKERY